MIRAERASDAEILLARHEQLASGRDRRPVFFTCIPDYQGQDVRRIATG